MKKLLLAFIITLIYSASAEAYVGLCCGKCGGNMPLNIVGGGVPETHELRIKLQPMFMRMEGLRDGTATVDADSLLTGMPAQHMAVPSNMEMEMLNIAVGYSFADDIFGGVMLMRKRNEMDMRFGSMMRASTGRSGFTMESEGMGDTMLMGKYRLFTDDPLIPTKQASLFFGLSVPTGSIDKKNTNHPMATRRTEQLPYAMQLGSGTFDPTVGILYQGSTSPWWWGSNLLYTGRLGDNKRDYSLGDELRLDLYTMYQLRYDTVLELQLNGRYWSNIEGEMDEAATGDSGRATPGNANTNYMSPAWDTANYGGKTVNATIGLQWQPVPLHILNLQLGIPLYQYLNGPQMEEEYRVNLTWYVEIPTKRSRRYTGGQEPSKSRLGF